MNLALFLPNWIGDVVMATPAIRALRAHLRPARTVAVCRPYVTGVLEGLSWLDETLLLDRTGPWSSRWPALAWKLRAEKIDVAVLFPNSFRSAFAARLGGCRRRVGFDRSLRGWLLTDRLQSLLDEKGRFVPCPVIDDYNRLATAVGCPWPGHRLELSTTPADERAADEVYANIGFTGGHEVICLNPGAAFGAAKCWHTEYFARLAQDLADNRDSRVLVLCGPNERVLARQIVRLAARPLVQSVADQTLSLGLTKALVRRCSLLVTTDSGPRHFAAAFDRPVVTLFGPTHIAWTETYFAKAVHLQKQVSCGPCQLRVCPLDHRCMKDLTPAEVFRAANDLLSRVSAQPISSLERRAS